MPDRDTETYQDFLREFQPGTAIGSRYKIIKAIGAGGMGRVFLAHDNELDIDVALKIIRPELLQSEKALDRFKNELLLARKVSHKNVVRIHDIGEIKGLKYLTMTYIPGQSIKDFVNQSGPMEPQRAVTVFTQICEGVAAAHEEGVIHRDLKPANVMLDEKDRVFLTDFGVARAIDSSEETLTGVIVGTPAYLSPEQTWGEKPDTRSDIYCLGLILYELLTGELPFDHETVRSFKSRLPEDLERRVKKHQPQIPPYLMSIIRKCLDPDRRNRYQDVRAILRDIHNQTVTNPVPVKKIAAIAAILIAAVAFGYVVLHRNDFLQREFKTQPTAQSAPSYRTLVFPFENKTGDQTLNWVESTIADLLISDLGQNSNLQMISSDRLYQTLKDLKISSQNYDEDAVKRISRILDPEIVIQGSVSKAGSLLRADAQINRTAGHSKTIYLKVTGNRQEDLLPMADQLAQQIRAELQPEASNKPAPAQISTASLPAWKSYNEGLRYLRDSDYKNAADALQRSIQTDPKFAKAYLKLSEAYEKADQPEQAVAILEKATRSNDPRDAKTNSIIRARLAVYQDKLEDATKIYQTLGKQYPSDPDISQSLVDLYEQTGDFANAVATLQKMSERDSNDPQIYFRLGKDTILMGDSEKAIGQYLIKALSLNTQFNDRHGQADVLNAMGVAYEKLGRYSDAIKYYNDSLVIKEQIGNKKGAATSQTNIAKIYIYQGEYDKARKILERTLVTYQELSDPVGTSDVMNTFGVISENEGRYQDALKDYKKSLQIRKDIGDDRLTAQSYDNIGQIHYLMANYDEAEVFWRQALELRKKLDDQNGVILSLQNMGFLQMAEGRLEDALKSFLDALQQSRSIQFENAIAVSLGNLGTIYQNQGRYDAAIESYRQAIDVVNKLNDKRGQAEYTKLLGSTYVDLRAFTPAAENLNRAMQLSNEIHSGEILSDVELLLGRMSRLQGRFPEAENDLRQAIESAKKNNYEKGLLAAQIEEGLWLLASDRIDEAMTRLDSAARKAADLNDVWLILISRYGSASLHLKRGDMTQAIENCQQAIDRAEKMGVKPLLIRFHSIAGQAYASLKNKKLADQHFRTAAAYIEDIKKSLKGEEFQSFSEIPEVKQVLSAER